MRERLVPLVLGSVALAGAAVAVVPQHAASIVQLLVATVVGCAVLVAVVELLVRDLAEGASYTPPSPLDRPAPAPMRPMDPPGLAAARRALNAEAPAGELPLSPAVWERLVARAGTHDQLPRSVSPTVAAALSARPAPLPRRGTGSAAAARPTDVAAAVARVLDEIEP